MRWQCNKLPKILIRAFSSLCFAGYKLAYDIEMSKLSQLIWKWVILMKLKNLRKRSSTKEDYFPYFA
jgi:hypothetical protein